MSWLLWVGLVVWQFGVGGFGQYSDLGLSLVACGLGGWIEGVEGD